MHTNTHMHRCIHSHKATCHHTDTTHECKELAEEYFMKKVWNSNYSLIKFIRTWTYFKDLFCVYVCVWVYVCLSCACSAHGSPKRTSDVLKLDGVTNVCKLPDVGAGNWIQVLSGSSKCSSLLSHRSGPRLLTSCLELLFTTAELRLSPWVLQPTVYSQISRTMVISVTGTVSAVTVVSPFLRLTMLLLTCSFMGAVCLF